MNLLYEENGQFKVASVVAKNDASYQVDTLHGKRAKIKAANVFFEFSEDIERFLSLAESLAEEIDIDFLWEVSSSEEFSASQIAEDYFGHLPKPFEIAAILIKLYAAPMYFYKKSKGFFKAAPEETLKVALLTIERRKKEEALIAEWVSKLSSGVLPEEVQKDLMLILHQPDKQSMTYKAFYQACNQTKKHPLILAQEIGGIKSIHDYLMSGFILQNFPKGIGFSKLSDPVIERDLPFSSVKAFTVDDISTTEIDDAISVSKLENGHTRVGVHIAAPSLFIEQGSAIEKVILERLSTVYFPGGKITMLPENWIHAFTLEAGKVCPVLSLYLEVNPDFEVVHQFTTVEKIEVSQNLRLHEIEPLFNPLVLADINSSASFSYKDELCYLYLLAVALKKQRGKYHPEAPVVYDYSIDVDAEEQVSIVTRQRDTPLDLLVSELMILANSHWAKLIHESNLPAIYRIQPTGKVRMSTKMEPHIGMGINHYAWCTSPLRRAADYINQSQILAALDFKPALYQEGDGMLYAALKNFESAYAAYHDFQDRMEYYWSLRYLLQEKVSELVGFCLKDDLVRIEGLPIMVRVSGLPEGLQNTKVKLRVNHVDILMQTVSLAFISRLEN